MVDIKRTKDIRGKDIAKITFTLREEVDKEKEVIEILEDIEAKDVFMRDAVTMHAESDFFKEKRANRYDGPGHRIKSGE